MPRIAHLADIDAAFLANAHNGAVVAEARGIERNPVAKHQHRLIGDDFAAMLDMQAAADRMPDTPAEWISACCNRLTLLLADDLIHREDLHIVASELLEDPRYSRLMPIQGADSFVDDFEMAAVQVSLIRTEASAARSIWIGRCISRLHFHVCDVEDIEMAAIARLVLQDPQLAALEPEAAADAYVGSRCCATMPVKFSEAEPKASMRRS